MCNHLPSFMPKYGSFDNRHVSRELLLIQWKISSISTPEVEMENYVQLLKLWQMVKLVLKQSGKAHGPLVFFVFLERGGDLQDILWLGVTKEDHWWKYIAGKFIMKTVYMAILWQSLQGFLLLWKCNVNGDIRWCDIFKVKMKVMELT